MRFYTGLTTVELIVTLFLAAMFIISGYQLFNAVSTRTTDSRELAEASSVAYRLLRTNDSYVAITNTCAAPAESVVAVGASSLSNPSAKISRCKPSSSSNLIRVTAVVEYGDSSYRRKALHAIYVKP